MVPGGTLQAGGRAERGPGWVAIAAIGCLLLVLLCFVFAKDLVLLLQDPVAEKGVRFLQLTPGEYFFTTVKVPAPCVGHSHSWNSLACCFFWLPSNVCVEFIL